MRHNHTYRGRRRHRRLAALVVPLALAVSLVGCDLDDILDVSDPEVATPGSVRTPAALPVVYSGAVRDFTYAYSGTGAIGGGGANDSHIVLTGLFTDELMHTGTFPTRRQIDRRDIPTTAENNTTDNATLSDAYHNLHRARRAAESAEDLFVAAEELDDPRRSIVASLAGYTYVLFGEIYCEGVPFSSVTETGEQIFAPPSTRAETFGFAHDHFDRAIEVAQEAGDEEALHLARIGKARALLNEGDVQGAADLVAPVPDGFVFAVEHSENTTGQENGVFVYAQNSGRYGVPDNEGGNNAGLPWISSEDPRTPVVFNPRDAFDASLDEYVAQNKYPDRNANVPLASGKEARLIQAEAALDDPVAFRTHINAARAQDGLDPLDVTEIPLTREGRVDLLFRERGFALWLTAHRLGDLRRLVRQYGRDADDVFPAGDYFRAGLTYGDDVNFPIYVDENNNPEFTGCINRDA